MTPVSIIIPTYNRLNILIRTINSVIESLYNSHYEIIIINDYKNHNLSELLPQNIIQNEKVFVYNNPKSGVAAARNFGATKAVYDYLLFLDDDIIVNKNAIENIQKFYFTSKKKLFFPYWKYPEDLIKNLDQSNFGKFMIKYKLYEMEGWLSSIHLKDDKTEIPFGASYFLFIAKKDFFGNDGGYNEAFPYAGAEDYDFFFRLKRKGFSFYLCIETLVYHNESDRIDIRNWLERKKRDSITKNIAVSLGYYQLKENHKSIIKFIYFFAKYFKGTLVKLSEILPFNFFTEKLIHLLTAIYIYEGSNKKFS